MKLYIYDHCPFCVRARMIFGLRNLPVQLDYFLNDDDASPTALIGTKQVPILQKADGSYMAESLDIVRYIDTLSGSHHINETIRPEVQTWFDHFNHWGNLLITPRIPKLKLPEFATQNAIDYFIHKKQDSIGSFEQHLAKTAQHIAQAQTQLAQLSALLPENSIYLNGKDLSMEDIIIFPLLRNLSMVKGLVFPPNLLSYIQNMAKQANVNVYFDQAI